MHALLKIVYVLVFVDFITCRQTTAEVISPFHLQVQFDLYNMTHRVPFDLMSGDLRDTAQYFCIEMARRGYLGSTKKDDFAAKCHSEALVSMTGALDSQLGKLYENIAFMQPNATQSSNGDGFFDAKITVSNKEGIAATFSTRRGQESVLFDSRNFCLEQSALPKKDCFDTLIPMVEQYIESSMQTVMKRLSIKRSVDNDTKMSTVMDLKGTLFRIDFTSTSNIDEVCGDICASMPILLPEATVDECLSIAKAQVDRAISSGIMTVAVNIGYSSMVFDFSPELHLPIVVATYRCMEFGTTYFKTSNASSADEYWDSLADCAFPLARFLEPYYTVELLRKLKAQSVSAEGLSQNEDDKRKTHAENSMEEISLRRDSDEQAGLRAWQNVHFVKPIEQDDDANIGGSYFSDNIEYDAPVEGREKRIHTLFRDGEPVSTIQLGLKCDYDPECVAFSHNLFEEFVAKRRFYIDYYLTLKRKNFVNTPHSQIGVMVFLNEGYSTYYAFYPDKEDIDQLVKERCEGLHAYTSVIDYSLCEVESKLGISQAIATRDFQASFAVQGKHAVINFNPQRSSPLDVALQACTRYGEEDSFDYSLLVGDDGSWSDEDRHERDIKDEEFATCLFPVSDFLKDFYSVEDLRRFKWEIPTAFIDLE